MSADVMQLPSVVAEGEAARSGNNSGDAVAHDPDELQSLTPVICYRDPADVRTIHRYRDSRRGLQIHSTARPDRCRHDIRPHGDD